MAGPEVIAGTYPDAVGAEDFATWTAWVLSRFGFRPTNALPLVSVCRDELMQPFQDAVHARWGPSFDASSLAAVPYLGRTGLAAALGHTPGEDGRHRFVVFAFPHIGIDADGCVGRVWRRGIRRSTTACGALVALHGRLSDGGLSDGRIAEAGVVTAPAPDDPVARDLDPDDVEMSLLTLQLRDALAGSPVPDLLGLTEAVRRESAAVLEGLVSGLDDGGRPVDHALFSGVVVHTDDGDIVAPGPAHITIDGRRRSLA